MMKKMSNHDFVKGECRHCAGHLEFPADAAGQTIPCPHCGQPTELRPFASAPKKRRFSPALLIIAAIILLALAGAPVVFLKEKPKPSVTTDIQPAAVAPATNLATAPAPPPLPPLKPGEVRTNNFDISPLKLQKTPGSSLVYVVGRVRNLSSQQRFGVKVVFALFDTNHDSTGEATDYQSVLDPKGSWDFKAMIMESKTASAKFNAILEDQ